MEFFQLPHCFDDRVDHFLWTCSIHLLRQSYCSNGLLRLHASRSRFCLHGKRYTAPHLKKPLKIMLESGLSFIMSDQSYELQVLFESFMSWWHSWERCVGVLFRSRTSFWSVAKSDTVAIVSSDSKYFSPECRDHARSYDPRRPATDSKVNARVPSPGVLVEGQTMWAREIEIACWLKVSFRSCIRVMSSILS
jgi:hypothetical protein